MVKTNPENLIEKLTSLGSEMIMVGFAPDEVAAPDPPGREDRSRGTGPMGLCRQCRICRFPICDFGR